MSESIIIDFSIKQGNEIELLDARNIEVRRNKPTLLLMPSGSGKTTFCEALAGLTNQNLDKKIKLTICKKENPKEDICDQIITKLVPQNAFRYFTELIVSDEIISTLENADIDYSLAYSKVISLSEDLNLTELLDRNPLTLSGGEVQQVSIAVALIGEPNLVILDDPYSELDENASTKLTAYLTSDLVKKGVKIIIFSSYADQELLRLSEVYVLEEKKVIPFYVKYHTNKEAEELLIKSGIFVNNFDRKNSHHFDYLSKEKKESLNNIDVFIDFKNLTFSYSGQKACALKDVTIEFYKKKSYAIIGHNGAGKSTLISIILGFEKMKIGSYKINNESFNKYKMRYLRKTTGIAFQTYHHYFFQSTPKLEIQHSLDKAERYNGTNQYVSDLGAKNREELIEKLCRKFDIVNVMDEIVENITVQQRRLLAIVCSFIEATDLLILDEPTAGLDYFGRKMIIDELQNIKKRNLLILIISHDFNFIRCCCENFIVFEKGELIKWGRFDNHT